MIDLDSKLTQARFAQMVGVTQPAVSGLIARGVLTVGDTAGNWLLAYCASLRETAAGRSQSGESMLNLNDERARLAAAQADKIEMENQVMRGELAPVATLEEVLVRASGKVASHLDALPGAIKRRVPSLNETEAGFVRREIAKVRNDIANLTLEDIEADDNEAE